MSDSTGDRDAGGRWTANAWATPANGLSLSRLALAPCLAAAVVSGAHGIALGIFAFAVASDLLDGRVARARGETSPLGGLLDHGADALVVTLGLGALAFGGRVPGLLPVLVAAAFAQYVIDSRAHRGRPLRTSPLGRWNGVAYFVPLGIAVVRDGLGLGWPADGLIVGIGWALAISTVASIGERLVRSLRSR